MRKRKTTDIIALSKFHNRETMIRSEVQPDGSYLISKGQYKTLMSACPYNECTCGIAIEDARGRQLVPIPSTSIWSLIPWSLTPDSWRLVVAPKY